MRTLASVIAAAAALAGCADGGDERLSREEFVEQATTICSRAEERIAALEEPGSVEELEAYASEARAITEEGVSDLRELEPPAELEAAGSAGDEAEARRVSGEIAETADGAAMAARAAGIPACEEAGT